MSRLPSEIVKVVDAEEIHLREGSGMEPAQDIIGSLNGKSDKEEIPLSIGGSVTVPVSKYKWIVIEYTIEPTMEGERIMAVDLANARGDMEVSLDVKVSTGEVFNLQVSHVRTGGVLGP